MRTDMHVSQSLLAMHLQYSMISGIVHSIGTRAIHHKAITLRK